MQAYKAMEPFRFYTRLHLSELLGLSASNLEELLSALKEVPGSCIYHHTHRFLQQHQYLSPEPPNDFAYWVREMIGEVELGERLASIDTVQFTTIRELRENIIAVIEEYLRTHPKAGLRMVRENQEFCFVKSISFVMPTNFVANDLKEFSEILAKISIDSIYFHIFEARLRLEKGTNDFSNWIENSVGNKKLALKITQLDPYTYTMEDLRASVMRIIRKGIPE